MSLSIGIVGLPNVGKSTLFNALTKKEVPAENYPFCTIDPSVGIVTVPDKRLDILTKLSKSAKTIPAVVEFVDIAGLVRGAADGEGLGNKFLSHIREVDAIAQVVRAFSDSKVTHVADKIDPLSDAEVINLELVMADAQTIAKRQGSIAREVKRGDKEEVAENKLLIKLGEALEAGQLVSGLELDEVEQVQLKSLHLLTAKPILYVVNTSEATENLLEGLKEQLPGPSLEIDPIFGEGLDKLTQASYELLDLITFFTTGEDETRAWTIKRGSTAPIAGTAIHTDFKDKFIKAEVITYEKLVDAEGYAMAREKGWVRTEGKEYIVQDGDVIEFKI
ncbi:MAG: redox-regulated ATPase YchF [Patescibacteria group bacterium]|nr:redox-regulated ATPase YchF [Patescibacteria group bacterium]